MKVGADEPPGQQITLEFWGWLRCRFLCSTVPKLPMLTIHWPLNFFSRFHLRRASSLLSFWNLRFHHPIKYDVAVEAIWFNLFELADKTLCRGTLFSEGQRLRNGGHRSAIFIGERAEKVCFLADGSFEASITDGLLTSSVTPASFGTRSVKSPYSVIQYKHFWELTWAEEETALKKRNCRV